MGTTDVASKETHAPPHRERIINDLSIQIATVNGSGSQTANTVLLRSIFQMGIPVSGKNLFPSNIAGLPTWFTIRASKHGYIARRKEIDFLVAMNPETADEDVISLGPGASVVYDEKLNLQRLRDDVIFYPVPFDTLVGPICPNAKLRKLVRNMIYDGVLAKLLNIPMEEIRAALQKQFKKKPNAVDLNFKAAQVGYEYTEKNLPRRGCFYLERMDSTRGKIIVDGNSAAALGAVFAGVTVCTWYPITPSSSLAEALTEYLKRFRIDPKTGKATFAVVQAEDELAAIGMALGAGWAGARSMTATSGPGISLMSEFMGLGYYAEVPAVIFDIQRVGPSTGLPTRTAQGDLMKNAYLSHGDTKHLMLIPSSVEECFTMAVEAFNLAEEFQTPVFVMSDLDLGMNNWMSDPFPYPEKPLNRGKVLTARDLERLGGFERYRDVDGDGIGYRTLPGTKHPRAAYFARGSGHNEKAQYSERPEDYVNNMDRLNRKFETARRRVPAPVIQEAEGSEIGVIAYGTTHWAIVESIDQLKLEYGLAANYCRVRAFPFSAQVFDFIRRHRRIYVVEQNRDAQMFRLLRMEVAADDVNKLRSVVHYKGIPIDARSVTDEIVSQEGK
ncbi:MAG: 2-oxoacid:acceptor oxidoreductase subunit alpha [Acidobacteria bacterium]|nr:2-oxoacid:acceptor oxidoreductase subunit alpha [Acidobacteriota bacterium]